MLYQELRWGSLSHLSELLAKMPTTWNGHSLRENTINFGKIPGLDVREFVQASVYGRRKLPQRYDSCEAVNVERHDRIGFFLNDSKKGAYADCIAAIGPRSYQNRKDDYEYDRIYLLKGDDKAVQAFCDAAGCNKSDLVLTSSRPKAARTQYERDNTAVFELNTEDSLGYAYGRGSKKAFWNKADIDFDDGGLYVEVNNWDAIGYGSPAYVVSKIKALRAAGIKVPTVYGVKTAKLGKFKKSEEWDSFRQWSKTQVEGALEKANLQEHINNVYTAEQYENLNKFVPFAIAVKAPQGSQAESFFGSVLEIANKAEKSRKAIGTMAETAEKFGISLTKQKNVDLKTQERKFLETYPMSVLTLEQGYGRLKGVDVVPMLADYINLVESQEAK
jgi:hypothetical protein